MAKAWPARPRVTSPLHTCAADPKLGCGALWKRKQTIELVGEMTSLRSLPSLWWVPAVPGRWRHGADTSVSGDPGTLPSFSPFGSAALAGSAGGRRPSRRQWSSFGVRCSRSAESRQSCTEGCPSRDHSWGADARIFCRRCKRRMMAHALGRVDGTEESRTMTIRTREG